MPFDEHAYETFWYWIKERFAIHIAKDLGHPKPWSQDPIFQQWKFCNVFRTDDTQTRWLLQILYQHGKESLALTIFNIYAFRAFNWLESYDLLRNSQTGWISSWSENAAKTVLANKVLASADAKLTSGAYMIKGVEGKKKYESIPEVLSRIWQMKYYLAERIQDEPIDTMEGLQELLLAQKFYGWGEFSTYQVVLDLMYTPFFNDFDPNIWCAFGPGAKRGIRCIWPEAKSNEMLYYATRLFNEQASYRDPSVPAMTLQDIEFSLCELSKYLRIERGGRSKATYAGI
jgi:hypothetical protein